MILAAFCPVRKGQNTLPYKGPERPGMPAGAFLKPIHYRLEEALL